jgi:hypothetical protein
VTVGGYFCSAVIHLYPHPSMESFNFWLRMDLVGICFAVWAPTAVFLEDVAWWVSHSMEACGC